MPNAGDSAAPIDPLATRQGFAPADVSLPRDTFEPDESVVEDSIGRYDIVHLLDTRGPERRYLAYDRELHRKATVSLLDYDAPVRERQQFLERARGQARLVHPHVNSVHEFGDRDGRVFVAVERTDGVPLRDWLATTPNVAAITTVAWQLCTALAAAHGAGLVHGYLDFDAIVVDADGSAKLGDFGRLWNDGRNLGNAREPATVERDRQRFCAMLAEILQQTRDPAGDSADAGRWDRWVRRELMRIATDGQRPVPAPRHRDMLRIAAAIERVRARSQHRRGLWVVGLLALTTVALGIIPFVTPRSRVAACSDAASIEAQLWAPHRVSVRAAILGTKLSFADDAWATLDRLLTDHAAEVATLEQRACVDKNSIEHACAERAHRRFATLAASLRDADALTVRNADAIAKGLVDLSACTREASAVLAETTAEQSRLTDELATVRFVMLSGHVSKALELASPLVDEVQRLAHPALLAEALLLKGQIERRAWLGHAADETLGQAIVAGERAGDVTTVARGWIERLRVRAEVMHRLDDGGRAAEHAQAFVSRLPHDESLQLNLDENRGRWLYQTEAYAASQELLERVLERRRNGKLRHSLQDLTVLEGLRSIHEWHAKGW